MTKKSAPAVNVGELELEHWQQGSFFAGSDTSFGAMLGLKDLGISYNEVPPGKSGCPFHNHHVEEELFVILDGEGEYRFSDQRIAISKGDVLGAPAGGPETAHQLINTGPGVLTYLAISTKARTEIVEYPDSGKFLAKTNNDGKATFRTIGRAAAGNLDYWDGEPGASND
ncbi:cupin domain-containing protein [Rhizobium sp. P40RR-XXII]|uniref:cupin domain-containing protein n=1 Tax=unclassified Rhizobium TaxID=2613769 RepID=UPI0014573B12|nr:MULTISPECIES: cupin domain-containing protein [unclassified Rhizobium]NLR89042.1 cupin domain-containing protein [Rhizobium sp. P28RR-XV]NLS20924.1 cupin domain-containing protein [Rhizobium sp. P40RR-XXII]